MVVFASGASSTVTCPTASTCSDPTGVFNPIRSLLSSKGYTAADLATFGYAGGAVNAKTHGWLPHASTCADSSTSYVTEVGQMQSMLRQLASANPNTDFSLVGLSQGGLLVFQMLGLPTALPKGSRLASVTTFDAPLGGVPLDLILQLEQAISSCWSTGGTSPAAQQLQSLWATTDPTEGVIQADRAPIMCGFVGVTGCPTETNEQVVAAVHGVVVKTWGSTQDAVFDPPACAIPGTFSDARSTQTVTGAGGGMHADGTLFKGEGCVLPSHVAGVTRHAADVAATIKPQQ